MTVSCHPRENRLRAPAGTPDHPPGTATHDGDRGSTAARRARRVPCRAPTCPAPTGHTGHTEATWMHDAGAWSGLRGTEAVTYLEQEDELREPLDGLHHQAVERDPVCTALLALLWGEHGSLLRPASCWAASPHTDAGAPTALQTCTCPQPQEKEIRPPVATLCALLGGVRGCRLPAGHIHHLRLSSGYGQCPALVQSWPSCAS